MMELGILETMTVIRRFAVAKVAVHLLVFGSSLGCADDAPLHNSVASYLDGAEIQKETYEQRMVILQVLYDMINGALSEGEALSDQRYANDQGDPDQWSALKVLRSHFVPQHPESLDANTFYRDVRAPEAQAVVRQWITTLRHAPARVRVTCPVSIHPIRSITAPPGWHAMSGPRELFPQHVALFEGAVEDEASLKPDNGDDHPNFPPYWAHLDPQSAFSMTCEYDTTDILARPLPKGISDCEEQRDDGNVSLVCY